MVRKQSLFISLGLGLSGFFLFFGYELLRSSSNTLLQKTYGVASLPLIMSFIPVAVFLMVAGYSRLLSAVGPKRTLAITSLFSFFVIFVGYCGIRYGFKASSILLYLFREAYIVLIIEQYWSLLNNQISKETSKKIYGIIAGIFSLGAISGGTFVHSFSVKLGTASMVFFSSLTLIVCAIVTHFTYRFVKTAEQEKAATRNAHKKGFLEMLGIQEFKRSPVLIMILVFVAIGQACSAAFNLNFQNHLEAAFGNADQQTAFSGKFYAQMNVISVALQFVGAPLLQSILPTRIILLLVPIIYTVFSAYALFVPSLASAGAAFMVFKSVDYSIFRTTKEMLYIPLSFDAQYRAKEVIDVLGYRVSKGGASLLFYIFERLGMSGAILYSAGGFACCLAWIAVTTKIVKSARVE